MVAQSPQLVFAAMLSSQPSPRLSPLQSAYGVAHVPTHAAPVQVRVHMWFGEHAAPQEPQLSSSVPRFTHAPVFGQHVVPEPPPHGPVGEVALHATQRLLEPHTWFAPGQSGIGSVSHAHVPLTHALPDAHGEQSPVGLSHFSPKPPQVQVPARQVVPVPHTALHTLQWLSSLARSTQFAPQHVVPALHVLVWLPAPPHATQWKFTQVSVAFGQDAGPRQVH
jgi:hypothetical protein